jgi:predicted Fe-Mo cluster-binding NifX family protein
MSKIAVMMSADRIEGEMSSHFGKAPWVLFSDGSGQNHEFVKNEALNGGTAAALLIRNGCTDAILADIGDGALRRLQGADIQVWAAPAPVAGSEALQLFAEGRLPRVSAVAGSSIRPERVGCCCAGEGAAHNSSRCCG